MLRARRSTDRLASQQLIWPLFVQEGVDQVTPIASMPGCARVSIDRAIELAELDAEKTRVVHYKPPPPLIDLSLPGVRAGRGDDLASLIDLATPRGYYLYSWLPSVVGAKQD